MQGYNPAAAALLPGARPLHQIKKPGQAASAEMRSQERQHFGGPRLSPGGGPPFHGYNTTMMSNRPAYVPSHQQQQLQSPSGWPSPSSQRLMPPPAPPHVPFMHPSSSPNFQQPAMTQAPGPLGARPHHGARPSLSMRIPSNSSPQPRLSPRMHSPSDSKAVSPYTSQGLPMRRHVPVKMPACKIWTRQPLSHEESKEAENRSREDWTELQPEAISRPQHHDEVKGEGLPESIDIYLPGAMTWMELLEQLINDRPLDTPIPPDLLAFKLNALRSSPMTLASGTASWSPAPSTSPRPLLARSDSSHVSSLQVSPSPAPQQPNAEPPSLSIAAPEFKPRLNPDAPSFSFGPPLLKPTAPVFTPRTASLPVAPPVIVEQKIDEEDEEQESDPEQFSYKPTGHEDGDVPEDLSESATNPSDEEQSGSEDNEDGDDEPLAHLAARQRSSLSDPAFLLHAPSSRASRSSFSSSSNPSDDSRSGSVDSDEDGPATGGHTSRSSRASEAIRRAVSNQGRRLSDQPPDPDPWLEGKEEILAVHPPALRGSFPGSKLSVDATEFRPASTPLPPSAFECSESGSEHQWFEGPRENTHDREDSEQKPHSVVVQDEQEGKDNMRSFKFPTPAKLKDSALHQQQHSRHPSDAASERPTRGHVAQPSGLAKSLAADPHGTAYLPRNSPESRQINGARAGPLPSLFEGEPPFHQRLMSYGDGEYAEDCDVPDVRRGQDSISHAIPLSHLNGTDAQSLGSRSRSDTNTSFETDPSNFNDEPQIPASWKSFEILLEGKLNDLRQDLTGFSTLKVDLESLKRDALVDALIGQLDRKLAEWTVDLGLSGRSSLDDGSLRHIAALLEDASRRTLDQVLGSVSVPQLQATFSDEDKEGLVNAIVAASNSSTFSPLVNLQGVVEQLRTTSIDAATQLVQLKALLAANPQKAQDPQLASQIAEVLVSEVRSAQALQLEAHILPMLQEVKQLNASSLSSEAIETLQEECRHIREQLATSIEGERLQSLVARAIEDVLPTALTSQRESSEMRLKEILNSVLSAIASSEQDSKLTHNSMSRFNDELSSGIGDLRELIHLQRDQPRPVDADRIAQLEAANRDLTAKLSSSQNAVQEQETISQRQANELDQLRRKLQEVEQESSFKDRQMQQLREQQQQSGQDRQAAWDRQTAVLESRLKEQDGRVMSLSRELGRSEGLEERLQSALKSDAQAREDLSEVEAELVDMKVANAKEATESASKLHAANARIAQLEADLERSHTVQEAARDMFRTASSSTSDLRATPPLEQSGFTDDVFYGPQEDDEHYQMLIRQQGTTTSRHNPQKGLSQSIKSQQQSRAASPAISVLHVPKPAEDGWWS